MRLCGPACIAAVCAALMKRAAAVSKREQIASALCADPDRRTGAVEHAAPPPRQPGSAKLREGLGEAGNAATAGVGLYLQQWGWVLHGNASLRGDDGKLCLFDLPTLVGMGPGAADSDDIGRKRMRRYSGCMKGAHQRSVDLHDPWRKVSISRVQLGRERKRSDAQAEDRNIGHAGLQSAHVGFIVSWHAHCEQPGAQQCVPAASLISQSGERLRRLVAEFD